MVVLLFAVDFPHHDYWGTVVFCIAMSTDWFDGRIARRSGKTSSFGSLLDPVADKVLVLATLVVLLDAGVFPAWMVAAIVGRELLISGLRLAALERGVVIPARDLGKLKTWSQAIAAVGRRARRRRRVDDTIAWWLLLVARRADVGLRLRLRPLGAADPARPRRREPARAASSRARRSRVARAANQRLRYASGTPPRSSQLLERALDRARSCSDRQEPCSRSSLGRW